MKANTASAPHLLDWTGHPLVDVGIATLCAMVDKPAPQALTLEDLDQAAEEMENYYFSGVMTSYLSCVFTINAEYTQPAGGPNKNARKQSYTERVLFAHRHAGDPEAKGRACSFSGRPATHVIERCQMPLLTGEGVLNFFPALSGGLPVSGPCLTALQALPLGGRRTEGRLLIVHADHPDLTIEITRRFLEDNRRILALAKTGKLPAGELSRELAGGEGAGGKPKYPDAKGFSSLILAELMEAWDRRSLDLERFQTASLTVYWLSNSGQGPSLDLHHLPGSVLRFLLKADQPPTRRLWKRLVADAWTQVREGRKESSPGGPGRSRNPVLDDLFGIYEAAFIDIVAALKFVRRHILPCAKDASHLAQDGHWPLTELFLKEVIGMDERRVEAIRAFADKLAEYIRGRNDRQLFRSLVYSRRPRDLRSSLVRAQREEARANNQLLFGMDEYIQVFEAEDNLGRLDWSLVRDLLSIRVTERLHAAGFLTKEVLGEAEPEVTTSTEE